MKIKRNMIITMGIVLNVIGAYIAMTFSIPIYMDSIGTIFVAGLLGPKYAMITGVLGSFSSGIIFDVYSFYYAPVQLLTGFFAGVLYDTKWLNGKLLPIGSILVGVPTSLLSAVITAGLFNGITASSSSALVLILNKLGLNLVLSILCIQVFTDYLDKLLAVVLSKVIIKRGKLDQRWKLKNGKI